MAGKGATPIEGFVRIPNERSGEWLPLLRDLYRFESSRIAGPGSDSRDINSVIWSLDEASEALDLDLEGRENLADLVTFLDEGRQIMPFPETEERPVRYLTRVADMVRNLGHTYEYWPRGRTGVTATRWLVEDKQNPRRSISYAEFRNRILSKLEDMIPSPQNTNHINAAKEVCKAVATSLSKDIGIEVGEVQFSDFQLQSTLRVLESRYGPDRKIKAQVLTAGVGSGKTIGFSIATLIEARRSMLAANNNPNLRTTSLFIYPRKQLALDQYSEISNFASEMNCDLDPWLEHYEGSYKKNKIPTTEGVQNEYSEHSLAKPVIITTYETLKRRMRRTEFMRKLAKHLSTVVLDEIHLTSGVAGGMASYILSRLSTVAKSEGREIYWIGASATIARPDLHASKLFGINPEQVGVVDPSEDELVQSGINHHIFIRPNESMSTAGVLVNATSLLLHQRRDDLSEREGEDSRRQKSIGFADNLEMLGRWNDDLKENERAESSPTRDRRQHPTVEDINNWGDKQREIPYALRFHKPLQRRLTSKGGDAKEEGEELADLSNLFNKEKASSICDKCRNRERVTLGQMAPDNLKELSKLVYRHPHREDDSFVAHRVDSSVFKQDEPITIGSHEDCPMMKAGACSWFPRPSLEKTYKIKNNMFEFSSAGRSAVYSAKSVNEGGEESNSLSSTIFRTTPREIYDDGSSNPTDSIPLDIVLASPSLEVGVDIPMLTESIMVKAVRNIASYRQKVGRVGRESNLDTVNVSLMTQSSVDLHYYRQPRKLVMEGRLEPVPLMDNNRAIIACSAYGSIWEWLALYSTLPEWVKLSDKGEISKKLRNCKHDIDTRKGEIIEHAHISTKNKLRDKAGKEIIKEAISQVEKEIELLLLPAMGTYVVEPTPKFDYCVADLFEFHREQNRQWGGAIKSIRKNIESIDDQNLDKIRKVVRSISDQIREIQIETFLETFPDLYEALSRLSYLIRIESLNSSELAQIRAVSLMTTESGELEEAVEDDLEALCLSIKKLIRLLTEMEKGNFDLRVESLFEDYKEIGDGKVQAFLSESMEKLKLVEDSRKDTWFVRPATLFENPYSQHVELEVVSVNPDITYVKPLDSSQRTVPLNEALYAFQPGSWTHRIPNRRLKARTGELTSDSGRLVADIGSLNRAGNQFVQALDQTLPAPPGSPHPVRVWSPTKLSLIEGNKMMTLDKSTSMLLDRDEQTGRGSNTGGDTEWDAKRVKIPRTFSNRWTWASPEDGEEIGAFVLPNHKYTFEEGGNVDQPSVVHPLKTALFQSIKWQSGLEVVEYTYSNFRQYTGAGEVEIAYMDEHQRSVGFGQKFETEGFSFRLDREMIKKQCEKIDREMQQGTPTSTPSLLKAFKAHLSTDTEFGGASLNPYTIEDFISVLLIHSEWSGEAISVTELCRKISDALGDRSEFRELAKRYYKGKMRLQSKLSEDDGEGEEDSDDLLNSRADTLAGEVLETIGKSTPSFPSGIKKWVHRTILSTLGVTTVTALQQFSGCDDNDVSYMIEPLSWEGEDTKIHIYDTVQFGNGSCATAKEYMHIPHICRHSSASSEMKLPTTDFLSTLEEKLLQCMQHQSDMGALAIHSEGLDSMTGLPDMTRHSEETVSVGGPVWEELGVGGTDDAWMLPLHRRLASYYEITNDMHSDEVVRACTSCWNGCPECVDQLKLALGGLRGLDFIDKYILDGWFVDSIAESDDFGIHGFSDIGEGSAKMHLGSLNRLHISDSNNQQVRSICLPWTMGFLTQRSGEIDPQLMMRNTDVSGLRIGIQEGTAMGIESHGFRRLLWFNLLMTGHLDSVGAIKEEDKIIQLAYFDARDISFKDIGLSPRMVDSMIAVTGTSHIGKLSDVLRWMLQRGFKVQICIDRMRAAEAGVHDLLSSIGSWENLSIRALPPQSKGNMHKKNLITPIAALGGSANLSFSAAELNQESIIHVMRYNETQYESLKAEYRTLINNAEELDIDNIVPRQWHSSGNAGQKHATPQIQTVRPTISQPKPPMDKIDKVIQEIIDNPDSDEGRKIEFKVSFNKGRPNNKAQKHEQNRPYVRKDPAFPKHTYGTYDYGAKDSIDDALAEAASMCNTEGGYVVIGLVDPKNNGGKVGIRGIDREFKKIGLDSYRQNVSASLKARFDASTVSQKIIAHYRKKEDVTLLILECKKSKEVPVYLKPVGEILKYRSKSGKMLWVRIDDSKHHVFDPEELHRWYDLSYKK